MSLADQGLVIEPLGGDCVPDLVHLSEWSSREHFAAFADDRVRSRAYPWPQRPPMRNAQISSRFQQGERRLE